MSVTSVAFMHNAHAQEREQVVLPSIEGLLAAAPLISSLGDALDRLRLNTPKWRVPYPQIRRIPPEAAPFVQPRPFDVFLASRPTAIDASYFQEPRDLGILALPQTSPCNTVHLAGVPMQHILRLYELSWDDVRPTFAIPQSQSEVVCRAIFPSGRRCTETIQQHCRGDSHYKVHVGLHQRRCLWEGCAFTIPDDAARQRSPESVTTILMVHMVLAHFQFGTRCPLCDNVVPTSGVSFPMAHPLLEHYQTGWCVGLARRALTLGRPVPRPKLVHVARPLPPPPPNMQHAAFSTTVQA